MKRLDWKPIATEAVKTAKGLGHTLSRFGGNMGHEQRNSFRMATCATCYGCCWISFQSTRGYRAGGRLLKYRCGTPEAQGFKSRSTDT